MRVKALRFLGGATKGRSSAAEHCEGELKSFSGNLPSFQTHAMNLSPLSDRRYLIKLLNYGVFRLGRQRERRF